MNHFTSKTLAGAALALCAIAAQAGVTNGNFAAGLTGWNPLGDVIAQAGTMTLTTAYNSGNDAAFNVSGNGAIDITAVEVAAGVTAYALDLPQEAAYEGSVAGQTFTVAAGDTLSFRWSFTTVEDLFQDEAFAVINGQVFRLATRSTAPLGLQIFTRTFASAATVALSFGVVDTGDYLGVSKLNISNVQVTSVPEPGTWALLLVGVGVIAQRLRTRKAC